MDRKNAFSLVARIPSLRVPAVVFIIIGLLSNPLKSGDGSDSSAESGQSSEQRESAQGGGNIHLSSDLNRSLNTVFDTMSGGSIDPESGTLNWNGKTFDIGSSRLFKARFERYLNQSASIIEDNEKYRDLISKIIDLLSPRHLNEGENVYSENVHQAYQLLFQAGDHPLDGSTSSVLGNMIYGSWRMRDEIREEYLRLHHTPVEPDLESPYLRERLTQMGVYGDHARAAALGLQAQLQYQTQIIYFITQRRFEHALMACYFYRALFRGANQKIIAGSNLLESMVPQGTNAVYTIEAFETMALEAINETGFSIEAIQNMIEHGDLVSAMERMQETFFLGEFLGPVSTFPAPERRNLLEVYRMINEGREMLELRDYLRLLDVSRKLHEMTNDSKFNRAVSTAESAMQLANLRLMEARVFTAERDFNAARTALQESAEMWPLNPELQAFSNSINLQVDRSAGAVADFDRALEGGNLRSIFERRNQYGLGLVDDPRRLEQLEQIINTVGRVDLLLSQAENFQARGNYNAAWELILLAENELPADSNLIQLKGRLIPHTHGFASALANAARLEDNSAYTLAYLWYQKALDIYPGSETALNGQERLRSLIAASGDRVVERHRAE